MATADGKVDKTRVAGTAATGKVREATLALILTEPAKGAQKERPFPCALCGKRFLSKSHFKEHQRVHTGERPFPCPQCERTFTTQHNLKRHLTIHTKEESYRCRKCGVLFCHVHRATGTDNPLSKGAPKPKHGHHTKAVASPLSSPKPPYLQTHPASKKKANLSPSPSKRAKHAQRKGAESEEVTLRRNAGGIKPIPMATADGKVDKTRVAGTAATGKVREATLALILTEPAKGAQKERPFPCSMCGKRFLSKSHLHEHERIHTGERPFPCPQCDRSYTTRHNLNRHLTIHTKEESYRCRKCGVLFCHVHRATGTDNPLSKPEHGRHPKAAASPPSSLKPPYLQTHPASKKKANLSPSPSKRAKHAQRKGAESEEVTLRRNAGGMQNKIAYDIEVVL